MEQKAYWNSVASDKEFTLPLDSELLARFISKSDTILDFGCGYGRTMKELKALGYQALIGIDFSEEMIRRGKSLDPQLDLRIKTGAQIDLPDSSVDAVLLFAVLTCIYKDEEQVELLGELRRVLKPNGILYVNDYRLASDARNLQRYQRFENKYGCYGVFELPEGAICRHHTDQWLKTLFSPFRTLCFKPVTFTTMNNHSANGFTYLGQKQ